MARTEIKEGLQEPPLTAMAEVLPSLDAASKGRWQLIPLACLSGSNHRAHWGTANNQTPMFRWIQELTDAEPLRHDSGRIFSEMIQV